MVSISFTALLLVALVAITQVVASPSYPRPCREIHPKDGSRREYVEPRFTPGWTSNLIRKNWTSTDGTKVQLKHLFQVQGDGGNLLLIKTTGDRAEKRIELKFNVNGDKFSARYFRIRKNQVCYVPATDNVDVVGIDAVSYYHRV